MGRVAVVLAVSKSFSSGCRIAALVVASVLLGTSAADGTARAEPPVRVTPLPAWPPGCGVTIEPVLGVRTLPAVRQAVTKGRLRILAIGSSSTSGIGASVAAARYPARLQARLRQVFRGVEVGVVNRGIPGETALGAAGRMKREVAMERPDLVLWQLGTNAALNNAKIEVVIRAVRRAVEWVRSQGIGLMFIDPQFVEIYENHEHYKKMVLALSELARSERVILVRRYASMVDIAARHGIDGYLAKDRFHLNDLGYRCMASYAAHAIVNASMPAAKTTADGK